MELENIKITPEVLKCKESGESEHIPVIISVEEDHTVEELYRKLLILGNFTENDNRVRKCENYLFVELSASQIDALASYPEVRKVWLDKDVSSMVHETLSTIGIENTSGIPEKTVFCEDITWAVLDDGIDKNCIALRNSNVIDVNFATGESPVGGHGTHVAGIIAGWWPEERFCGVAPKCQLYNIKVAGQLPQNQKASLVIQGMEWIRTFNKKAGKFAIQGANLSWGIPFTTGIMSGTATLPFQPGLSPICEEANRLVKSGVVLTVSAGNYGIQAFNVPGKTVEQTELWVNIATSTIADPGTAELPITVGSTHKRLPEKYGISLFSAKGPTGDGRCKPDLVAPGEKIRSCIPDNKFAELSGTSQAAPCASGAAIRLMHAHPWLIGKPDTVKSILKMSCRDLGRDPFFQGKGLVDIHRALHIARERSRETATS